jgi:hypothetical protein
MNYYKKAAPYRYADNSEVSVLECNVSINLANHDYADTVIYWFTLSYDNVEGEYQPTESYFAGIGYSYKEKNFFPMPAHSIYPSFAENKDTCSAFFERHEKGFVHYLKFEYKGKLSPWLRQEAIRRRIL